MTQHDQYPILLFREPFDERTAWEVAAKGWYSGLSVEAEGGLRYQVFSMTLQDCRKTLMSKSNKEDLLSLSRG